MAIPDSHFISPSTKSRSAPKWHRMYYLLAAFDVLVVLTSLYLSHQILQIYNHSLEANREWKLLKDKNAELATLAGLVNAPGNNVFDSHDVKSESAKMRSALQIFSQRLDEFREDLKIQNRQKQPSQEVVRLQIEELPKDLISIQAAMSEMTAEADLIFSYFSENEPERAGRRMATMDQKYATVLSSLGVMREHISKIQDRLFQQELESADSLRRFDYMIAIFVLMMVGGALVYGHKIRTRMEAVTTENDSYLHKLELEIAERRAAEEARDESEHKLSLHIQKTPLAAIEVNVKGEVVEWNPAAETIFGYSRNDVVGRSVFDILVPESMAQEVDQIWQELLLKRGGWRTQLKNLTKDGRIIICDWYNTSLESNGQVIGVASLAQDITDRTRMENELAQAHEAALESARLKSEFLANMSHEIRTPMNGVIGMTGLLLDTQLDSEQREFAETIRFSGDALLTIINDILDFSKIEAGKLEFEVVDFDLQTTIEETMELLSGIARAKNLEFAALVTREVPRALRGDPGRLRQILTNLVGNALKFTEEGEVIVRCEKEAEDSATVTIRFTITDTGIGISETSQAKLFQAFTQADGSMTRKYGGTGLGLSISRQLVELMAGEMGVISRPGEGAQFWFTAQLEKQQGKVLPTTAHSLIGLRALIVDDNTTNRKILAHQLGSWGMIHDEVDSGAQALKVLTNAIANGPRYDVAILDLLMPAMDGLELARSIKQDTRLASTSLVLLTSAGPRIESAKILDTGIAAYLTKPVKQSQLFECLSKATRKTSKELQLTEVVTVSGSSQQMSTGPLGHILLAEDNLVNQKVAMRQLQKLGYSVDVVGDGREAIEALSRTQYDLVLMDCQMPVMDGYEATIEIRRREGVASRIPIVAMTAHAMDGDRQKSLAAGMDDHVNKPVKPEELAPVLKKFLVPVTTAFSPLDVEMDSQTQHNVAD